MLRAIQFISDAVEYLEDGLPVEAGSHARAARYECDCIEGLIAFDGDTDFVDYVGEHYGLQRPNEARQAPSKADQEA